MSAAERIRAEIQVAPSGDDAPSPLPPKKVGKRGHEVAEIIASRVGDPWVSLFLGSDELAKIRTGGIVVVMGPTGAGKSSLVCGFLVEHARSAGPVVVLSRELPADELGARIIGMQCDASWPDVLMGKVMRSDMDRSLSGRLLILDREEATVAAMDAAIEMMQAEFPGEPVLCAVDYVQIVDSDEREVRARVADVVAQVDRVTRNRRVVTLLISQMSRAASRAARAGENLGAESTDGGAESAAIERVASVTFTIGAQGEERSDGTRAADISIGKNRMWGGDRVVPMSYCGRSGRWRMAGDARAASEVRAERQTKRTEAKLTTHSLAIRALLQDAKTPLSRRDIREKLGHRDADVRAAVNKLLADPDSGVVEVGRRGGAATLWIRALAERLE